jgi:hypothetical protein
VVILKFKRNVYFDFFILKLYFFIHQYLKNSIVIQKFIFIYLSVHSLREEKERLTEFRV